MLASIFTPPPVPDWEGVHPLIVHLPIGVLLVAPLFVLLSFLPRIGRCFALGAWVLLLLGTVAAYVAVKSGEAAAQLVVRTPDVAAVLEEHQRLAVYVRASFTFIAAGFTLGWLGPRLARRFGLLKRDMPNGVVVAARVLLLAALGFGCLLLANTGHLGGRLVHEFGVHAWLSN